MLYAVVGFIVLCAVGVALYFPIKRSEFEGQISTLHDAIRGLEDQHAAELKAARAELAKLERIKHIPDVIDRAARAKKEAADSLDRAQKHAREIVLTATREAELMTGGVKATLEMARQQANEIVAEAMGNAEVMKGGGANCLRQASEEADDIVRSATSRANGQIKSLTSEAEATLARARDSLGEAERRATLVIGEAHLQSKEIAKQARKVAKEKIELVDIMLGQATDYALDIRRKAEERAEEVAGEAYVALRRHNFYEATARALKQAVEGYAGSYKVPAAHMLDEWSEEYGFHQVGQRLKLARDRTRVMQANGTAATCDYDDGWKKTYAIRFVLDAFDGKVDSILARIKPANHGRLIREIQDAAAMVNLNGEVFKNARIQQEYVDSRLEELKWAVAVQRLKDRQREEQRSIREQIREEEKARKEYEKAIKQALKEEELIGKALAKARKEFEQAGDEEKAKYEAKLGELGAKLLEVEEKNRKAISMAQQTKCGHVYIISNIGSFGEDVYKIGLTRRLDPTDRVRELGDASVPFPFDVHAMIYSEEAPALETALHKRFVDAQVNKANRRKEFFRVDLGSIKREVEGMGLVARWTLAADAREYQASLALERAMKDDGDLRRRWVAEQESFADRQEVEEVMEEVDALADGVDLAGLP